MNLTNISWTDWSSNFVRYLDPDGNVVHACIRASEGCRFCYSQALAARWGRKGKEFTAQNMKRLTPFFDMKEARRVLNSKLISGKRLFPNDMTDWMGPWLPDEIVDQCVALFALRPDVTFQTLTKHADRQLEYFSQNRYHEINLAAREITGREQGAVLPTQSDGMVSGGMPLPNLHIGVSAEDQPNLDKRAAFLLKTLAAVRWVSYEPLLGEINATPYLRCEGCGYSKRDQEIHLDHQLCKTQPLVTLDWGVVGAESGNNHRPMELEWLTSLVDQYNDAALPIFVKQDSGPRPGVRGRIPDAYWVKQFPLSQ